MTLEKELTKLEAEFQKQRNKKVTAVLQKENKYLKGLDTEKKMEGIIRAISDNQYELVLPVREGADVISGIKEKFSGAEEFEEKGYVGFRFSESPGDKFSISQGDTKYSISSTWVEFELTDNGSKAGKTLQQKLQNVKASQNAQLAKATLEHFAQQEKELASSFPEDFEFSVARSEEKGKWRYTVPLQHGNMNSVEEAIFNGVKSYLDGKYGKSLPSENDTFVSFVVEKKIRGRSSNEFSFDYQGSKLTGKITTVPLPLDYSSKKVKAKVKKKKKKAIPVLPEEEWHQPQIELDQIIEIDISSRSDQYDLIPTNKAESKFFPGYAVPFIIQHDGKDIETYRTSGQDKRKGADSGSYFTQGMNDLPWKKLREDGKVVFKVVGLNPPTYELQ